MKTKAHSAVVKNKVTEMHKAGNGYEKYQSLNIPLSTAGSIIRNWKIHHSTQTLTRTSRPSKLSVREKRRLVSEATKNPSVTLSLQSPLTETGVKGHGSTILRVLHKTGLLGRVTRGQPLLKKVHIKACTAFATEHEKDPVNMWEKVLWSDVTKIDLFGKTPKST